MPNEDADRNEEAPLGELFGWGLGGAVLGFTLTVLLGVAILAVATAEETEADAPVAAVDIDGEAIYQEHCARCHGNQGEGGVGPQLNEGRVVGQYPDVATQILVVELGRNAMPAFASQLSTEEIEAVVEFEREGL